LAEILTQSEIDALLESVSTTEGDKQAVNLSDADLSSIQTPKKRVTLYDFKRPNRISKDQLRTLRNLHEKLARNMSSSLSAYLRVITDVTLISVDQMTYGEFLMSLPDPTSFNIISMEPLEGNSVLEFNPSLVFPIIDKLLGGIGVPLQKVRQMTEIEQSVLESVILLLINDIVEMWRPLIEMRVRIETSETSPHVIQIVSTNEVVILVCFEIKISEISGIMNMCMPAMLLEPIMSKLDSQDWFGSAKKATYVDNEESLRKIIIDAHMKVEVVLGKSKIMIKDLLNLKQGDILKLDQKSDKDIVLNVSDIPKFWGRLGVHDGNKAIKISREVSNLDMARLNKYNEGQIK